ncbi:MAG: hypothetical protein M1838_005936 [Thelocarpon superellum]|nr:MAG: hypothetical protein M1838_005936 [Thelocarpon superellum]
MADSSLYGIPRPKKHAKEISTSTSLAFASQLSSLLSAKPETTRTTAGRARPSAKPDLFQGHNKHIKKRAARDLEDDGPSAGEPRQDLGGVEPGLLHRSKRKMEEKARLYGAMKRGDYLPPEGDARRNLEEVGLVDFDRKWAEGETRGQGNDADTSSEDVDSEEELVEYLDEFGRLRKGTKAQAAKEARRKQLLAADEPDRFSARPSQPSNLIFGDTVQAAAFNPDEPVAMKMEELARKRDRSLTPPEEVHYDATSEVRSKGVGFYAFSKDATVRKREMDQLERERVETERTRQEQLERKGRKQREMEARRKVIREKRGQKEADRFLEDLGGSVQGPSEDPPG